MDALKNKIAKDGEVLSPTILKVDTFLNHGIDPNLLNNMGKEFASYFAEHGVTKILTIEASGIAIAVMAGLHMNVPVVFAKKHEALNLDSAVFTSKVFSHTKAKEYIIKVAKKLLSPDDKVLIIDDFLANGLAALGLIDIVEQSGATVEGIGIAIEKAFQSGGKIIRDKGYDLYSLAIIESMDDGEVVFG